MTTHAGGRITRHGAAPSAPPRRVTQTVPARDLPFDRTAADRYANWEALGGQVGNAVDIENIPDTLNGEGTDDALSDLAEIIRPRSWARHTVLLIRFRYPLMEPMPPAMSWNTDAIPFGDTMQDKMRNAAKQNEVEPFTLMAGSTHSVEIPYPVGTSMPVHFDIINPNPIYAANVNMSAIVYTSKQ
ncbi:hypothetical protein B5V46_00160 [Rhodovulum sp. MB263]|nr:hypothetical protein B5V46_00160 [Rhodovulum sp. MB263]